MMRGPLAGTPSTSSGACRPGHPGRQGRVVHPAVEPAGDEGDPAIGEGVERGKRRQHVRRQAVVDERHAVDGADDLKPAGQRLEALRGARERFVVRGLSNRRVRRAPLGP